MERTGRIYLMRAHIEEDKEDSSEDGSFQSWAKLLLKTSVKVFKHKYVNDVPIPLKIYSLNY